MIGDRWSLLIVAALMDNDLRYNELADRLSARDDGSAIAPNVLAARLRHLEAARLIAGEPYQDRPRRLRYSLTRDGRELSAVLGSLEAWGEREGEVGAEQRTGLHDRTHGACGTALQWRAWCPTCGTAEETYRDRPIQSGKPVGHSPWPETSGEVWI